MATLLVRGAHAALLLLLLVLPLRAAPVRAQSCHGGGSLRDTADAALRVEASALAASYGNASYVGEYQGGALVLRLRYGRFNAHAGLAGYRITRNGLAARGLGDVPVGLGVTAYRVEEQHGLLLELGPALDATLPAGQAERGLGMGHVMLMPGAFLRLSQHALSVRLLLAYGRALAHGTHGHVHGPSPLVNPMNRSEVEHAFALRYQLVPLFALAAGVAGAVPVADRGGAAREAITLGGELLLGAFDVALEQELPLVGDPFRARTVLRVGAQW
jgi:hypothetical protein